MTIPKALHILSQFWLKEVRSADIDTLAALPQLAEMLPNFEPTTLTDLAVEYQRLFGFNLPPYESIFVDPSVMLQAPATARVMQLYQQGGWDEASSLQAGAVDHIGIELLALAHWLGSDQMPYAHQLVVAHLALWIPAFGQTLRRLNTHPFYARLADLTVDLVLALLSEFPLDQTDDPFPHLPPPPVFRASETLPAGFEHQPKQYPDRASHQEDESLGLRQVIKKLLPPCEAGLFITREDCARIGQRLNLASALGDRYRMLETLFQQAGQYDLVPDLLDQLLILLETERKTYQQVVAEYPAWQLYGVAWMRRIDRTEQMLEDLKEVSLV